MICMKRLFLLAALFTSSGCVAQQPAVPANQTGSESQTQSTPAAEPVMVTVPAGTRILLELRRTISTKSARPGDSVYLQTIAPVVINDKTMIPVGTYIQGTLDGVNHHGANGHPELRIHLANLTLANGYSVAIPGTVEFGAGREYTYYERPEIGGATLAVMASAPIAGTLIGGFAVGRDNSPKPIATPPPPFPFPTLAPLPSIGPNFSAKGAAIGFGVGAGAALAVFLIDLNRRNVVMEAGLSSEMTLEQPLQLRADRVQDAVLNYKPPVIIHTPPIIIRDTSSIGGGCSAGQTACGVYCCGPFETCSTGTCKSSTASTDECPPGQTKCMGSCVSSFFNDDNNCGSCGRSCGIGESCRGGSCSRTFPCRPDEIGCN